MPVPTTWLEMLRYTLGPYVSHSGVHLGRIAPKTNEEGDAQLCRMSESLAVLFGDETDGC